VDVVRAERRSTGVAADGVGAGIVLFVQDASGNIDEAGSIDAVLTTAAHATEAGAVRINVLGVLRATINSAGDLILTNDARFAGGLYVGRADIDPAVGNIYARVDDDLSYVQPQLQLTKARAAGGNVAVNDFLGGISFRGFYGASYQGAQIRVEVDGTPGASDMPGRIVLATTPDGSATSVDQMHIKSDGAVRMLYSLYVGSLGTSAADNCITADGAITGLTFKVGANQVVGARVVDARIDDAINSGDATTDGVIDALRDAAIAHGWIAAA
jgi:hypothetical protein